MLDGRNAGIDNLGMAKKAKAAVSQPAWSKRLAAARLMVSDNQTDFAKSIGLSQQRYNNYELGLREPKIAMWVKIHQKLNVSMDFIFFGDSDFAGRPASPAKSPAGTDGERYRRKLA